MKLQHIQALIWDLDNTITDSSDAHFLSWDSTLKKYNIPHDRNFFDTHYGMSNREIFETFLTDYVKEEDIDRISEEKEISFRNRIQETPVNILPGVKNWLDYCLKNNIIQALASSGPMINIVAQIHSVALGDYFHVITSGSPLANGKPHPQVFLNAAAGLGIDPKHCLVIEDTLHGIEAALRGGMHCILVRNHDDREQKQIEDLAKQYAQYEDQYLCVPSLAELAPQEVLLS